MKLLMLNQDWFAPELRQLGHEVVTYGSAAHMEVRQQAPFIHIEHVVASLPKKFRPDRIIVYDESCPLSITGLETTDIPCVFYSVDAHHHTAFHKYLAHVFDHTFVAQRDYIAEFNSVGISAEWMPLWASRMVEASSDKKYGAVFVGTMDPKLNPDRVRFFEDLKKRVPILCTHGAFWEIFPFSEIVVNQTVKGDLNFRVFEAMMCGPLLLTENSGNGLFELFRPDVHIATYDHGNVDQAADAISGYLSRPDTMRQIAAAGRAEVISRHLAIHRAEQLDKALKTLSRTRSP